uniref:Uncharacterized protein n=1 Tax=Onchocerca volvulus TaxID=6282 RepID=A0A8R1XUW4_ONCVO
MDIWKKVGNSVEEESSENLDSTKQQLFCRKKRSKLRSRDTLSRPSSDRLMEKSAAWNPSSSPPVFRKSIHSASFSAKQIIVCNTL